jgi:hypothetical protein
MRWLRRSSETPQLLGLSPLKSDDAVSISSVNLNAIDQDEAEMTSSVFRNQTPNQSTRKSRIGENVVSIQRRFPALRALSDQLCSID